MEAGKLGDDKATSGVDSHAKETAPRRKPLVIVTCENLKARKYDEATSDVDSSREIRSKIFNEGYSETIVDLMNTYEDIWKKELESDEIKNKSFRETCREELGNIKSDEFHKDKDAMVQSKKATGERLARTLSCIGVLIMVCTYSLKLAIYGVNPARMECWFVGLINFDDYGNN
ncbi:hypothetical protein M0802_016307 [Mischocyttarus mexicanus]|nr:hypothetical protein M0802_016307 [Mischocyttarus mexicanus]